MRTTIFLTVALLAGLACQWSPPQATSTTKRALQVETAPAIGGSETTPEVSTSASRSFTPAQFEQHVRHLKKRLPSREFSIVIQPPFVVVGDEPIGELKRRSESTVKWAV